MSNLKGLGLDVIACTTPVEAISGAEIIITYSAGKQCAIIFSDNMIGAGVHINAIGGDCLGKTILHSNILRRYNIFVSTHLKRVLRVKYNIFLKITLLLKFGRLRPVLLLG